MTKKAVEFIREWFGDGHSIIRPDAVPWEDLDLVDSRNDLVQVFRSDASDPKSTIFKNGKVQERVFGVYTLDLWYTLARKHGVGDAGKMFMGRGRQAHALCAAILKEVDPQANPNQV